MQIVTKQDLEVFKADLLKELSQLIKNSQTVSSRYLNSAEVRRLFRISETKLFELRRDYKIPFIKVDGKYLYNEQDLLNSFKTV